MNDQTEIDAFNIKLRQMIGRAIVDAHRTPGQEGVTINNSTVISALLDAIAAFAATYRYDKCTPEELVKKYMVDLPDRIMNYRDFHAKHGIQPHSLS